MAQSKQTISGQPQVLNNQATIKTSAISSQNIQPIQVGQINKGLNDSQQNPQTVCQKETPKEDKLNSKQPFLELSMQSLIELIQKYKLHYDPFYTRIYGIMHDVEYLKNANGNFEIAYKNLIEYLKKNDRLTRWYEKEIKDSNQIFHYYLISYVVKKLKQQILMIHQPINIPRISQFHFEIDYLLKQDFFCSIIINMENIQSII
ncbi:hypothetical protein pb186bvf_004760 [Paramecium bursaria]